MKDLLYFDHFLGLLLIIRQILFKLKPILTCFYFLKPSFGGGQLFLDWVVNYFLDLPGQLAWIIQQCGEAGDWSRGGKPGPTVEVAKRCSRRGWGIIWEVGVTDDLMLPRFSGREEVKRFVLNSECYFVWVTKLQSIQILYCENWTVQNSTKILSIVTFVILYFMDYKYQLEKRHPLEIVAAITSD